MFCSNCGAENPAGTGFCATCGQTLGSIAAAAVPAAPRAPAKPQGTQRNLALMPLWLLLTANLYWLFWAYQTYKEIRAHTPAATPITPGKAIGFLFIPFFNIYWFFRVVLDLPRAIRRVQEDDPRGEPLLNPGLVSGLLIAGMVANAILGRFHLAFLLLGEPLLIAGFVLAQASLNAHWSRHAVGVLPGASLPGTASAATPQEYGFARLLGVRGPQIEWGAAAAFLVASLLGDLVFLLIMPLVRHEGMIPVAAWASSFIADLLLTGAVVAAFRWLRNDAGAAALAAVAYTLLQAANRFLFQHFLEGPQVPLVYLFSWWLANFLFLLILASVVRSLRPIWLGLWVGATAGQLAASLAYRIGSYVHIRFKEQLPYSFHIDPWDVVSDLLFAAVFAFAFWGGLALMAPRVLRD